MATTLTANVWNLTTRVLTFIVGHDENGKVGRQQLADFAGDTDDFFRRNANNTSRGVPAATPVQARDAANTENPLVPSSLAGAVVAGAVVSGNLAVDGTLFGKDDLLNVPISGNVVIHTISDLAVAWKYTMRLVATGGPWAVTVDAADAHTANFSSGVDIPANGRGWFTLINDGTNVSVVFSGFKD